MYTTAVSLIERLRQPHDHQAWTRFVDLYSPFLYHCVLRFGLVEPDAADAVQEIFLLLINKLPAFQYSKDGSFRAWLRTVTVHKCLEMQRKRRETAVGGSGAGLSDLVGGGHDSDQIWDEEYRQFILARILQTIQVEFEPVTWQAFWQTTVEEQPVVEVARRLETTTNAVYCARSRVLRRLREQFGDLLDQ